MPPRLLPLTAAALLAAGLAATPPRAEPAASAPPAAVIAPYDEARFVPLDPARPDGPAIAVLRGDPATGPSAMLMRFGPAPGRLHVHTADYQLVVLEGRMKHWTTGPGAAPSGEAAAPELGPGAFWFQPGGQPHADVCLSARCVMFIVWSGARDGRLAE